VLNYNLPKFEYESSLPKLLAEAGYRSEAYHGNWGTFYRRRPAFEKMGFDDIFFREELQSLPGMAVDGLGLRDDSVLSYSLERMSLTSVPTCHFVITLTSHTPYTFVPASSDSLYPHPAGITERYLNHLQYLDDCLRKYVAGLGEDVTFVLYSDHSARVSNDVFSPSAVGGQDLIPFFIYDGAMNLAAEQRTRDLSAIQGELSLLDVIWYLRNQVRNCRSSDSELSPPTVSH
jgi:lipoteichoic acid synthase